MSNLTEFLLARIAEDEVIARAAVGDAWRHGDLPGHVDRVVPDGYITFGDVAVGAPRTTEHIIRHDPARVLAECEAKRRIVERLDEAVEANSVATNSIIAAEILGLSTALHFLALPYADHPDYREEWKP